MTHDTRPARRVFLPVSDPARFVEDIASSQGAFVPTRLPLALGEHLVVSVRLKRVQRPIELPVVVLGRRAPRGARGSLSAGVVVRLTDEGHPMVALLREVAGGRVVDLEERIREHARTHLTSRFPSLAELRRELQLLLDGEAAMVPLHDVVHPGDRLVVTAGTADDPRALTFHLLVKGLANHDEQRACRGVLFDDDSRRAVLDFLAGGGPRVQHRA